MGLSFSKQPGKPKAGKAAIVVIFFTSKKQFFKQLEKKKMRNFGGSNENRGRF